MSDPGEVRPAAKTAHRENGPPRKRPTAKTAHREDGPPPTRGRAYGNVETWMVPSDSEMTTRTPELVGLRTL